MDVHPGKEYTYNNIQEQQLDGSCESASNIKANDLLPIVSSYRSKSSKMGRKKKLNMGIQ